MARELHPRKREIERGILPPVPWIPSWEAPLMHVAVTLDYQGIRVVQIPSQHLGDPPLAHDSHSHPSSGLSARSMGHANAFVREGLGAGCGKARGGPPGIIIINNCHI